MEVFCEWLLWTLVLSALWLVGRLVFYFVDDVVMPVYDFVAGLCDQVQR